VPVSAPLVRLYLDYMHTEYGELDCDYVFVNLWADPVGRPLRYQAVAKLVERLRTATGVWFTPHMLRHSRATELIRGGVPIKVVATLLTPRSVATTSDASVHLTAEDVRAELVRRGIWDADEPATETGRRERVTDPVAYPRKALAAGQARRRDAPGVPKCGDPHRCRQPRICTGPLRGGGMLARRAGARGVRGALHPLAACRQA
jgi:hypothetical protein